MSVFDPKILEETVIEGANATKFDPVPINAYEAWVRDVEVRSVTTKNGEQAMLTVTWGIPDDKLRELLNREIVTSRQDVWLDLNADGSIAVGPNQNVRLGRLRAALKMNDIKGPFSFGMLRDAGPAIVTVSHRTNEETGDVYDEIKRVDAVA